MNSGGRTASFPPTGAGLVAFIDFAMQRGVVRPNTGANYKVACMEILPLVLGDRWRDQGVFDKNVEWLLDEFARTRRDEVTPAGREHFREQLIGLLDLFRTYAERGEGSTPEAAGTTAERPTARMNGTTGDAHGVTRLPVQILAPAETGITTNESEAVAMPNGNQPTDAGVLTYPFPLRRGVVVTMSFPVDLTTDESRRLARFIESLTIEMVAVSEPGKHVQEAPANGVVRRRTAVVASTRPRKSSATPRAKAGQGS